MDTFLYKEIWIKWKFIYLFILNNKGVSIIFREELRNLSILKIEFVFNSPVEYIYIYVCYTFFVSYFVVIRR